MKRRDQMKEIRSLSHDELRKRVVEHSEELMKLRMRKGSGQLDHAHRMGEVRRARARALEQLSALRRQAV